MERKRKPRSNGRPRYNTAGEGNGMSRLNADKVREIVARVWAGAVYQNIADSFGVHDTLITGIMRGLRWASVTSQIPGFIPTPPGRRKGVRHRCHKLTEADVLLIRQRLAAGHGIAGTAKLFGVDYRTVHGIKINRIWKHVQLPTAKAA